MKTMAEYKSLVENKLQEILPENYHDIPETLLRAMRYSLLLGGKRLRPVMLLATVDMLGGDLEEALIPACCVEMIHTYSLIHDDLPGMDNDTLRRGNPTNHVVFGEGQAILAGDGLLSFAFEMMLENAKKYPEHALRHIMAISEIAEGAGARGMVAGQSQDLLMETQEGSEDDLLYIHKNKTARMFVHPMRAAAMLCGADDKTIQALTDYASSFGMIFQASDDILDVISTTDSMGKTTGKDAEENKLTAVKVYGLEEAQKYCERLLKKGMQALDYFGDKAEFFRILLQKMATRKG